MPKMTKAECSGCRGNFYNGNNSIGVSECWMFKGAQMVKRKMIPIQQPPPYSQPTEWRPNCYSAQGYVCVKPEAIRKDGFWAG